ncbi:MAG: TolC family protein [Myxococcales bacterium]|nr:TolC family protein [Myxococcales bacterium]MCB9649034.1 TolC family protein [Deltaproteobacteria bacterium]
MVSAPSILARGALAVASITIALPARAAPGEASKPSTVAPVEVGLEEAVEIALERSYRIQQAKLTYKDAEALTDASYWQVWPTVDASAGYTRNLLVPNPFAGTGAGSLFDGFDALGWLAYNADADPTINPNPTHGKLSFEDYQQEVYNGLIAGGVDPNANSNPFFVGNQFRAGVSVSQVLYNGAVFSGIKGSERFLEASKVAVKAEAQQVVAYTARVFYAALLAQEQTKILDKSVARSRDTAAETAKRVSQGVLPQFAQLSSEVELANKETELFRARNLATSAMDILKLALGLPPAQALKLKGELALAGQPAQVLPLSEAMDRAFEQRPDLRQARLQVEVLEIQEDVTWAEYLPIVRAVGSLTMQGSVPDDRTVVSQDPTTFAVTTSKNSFFADPYWNPSASVGLTVTWNIFNGFLTSQTLERNRVSTSKARLDLGTLEDQVRVQVEQALRDLDTARQQIATQERNIERAELNYSHAEIRVREGVSTQLELREASQQLDQSRFAYRQAIHDYLVARVSYDVAIGEPPVNTSKDTP